MLGVDIGRLTHTFMSLFWSSHSHLSSHRCPNNVAFPPFRYNKADQCLGAGIRLGGHVIDGFVFGVNNDVYGNDFTNTEEGAIKSRQHPQGIICGNTCTDGDCNISEEG